VAICAWNEETTIGRAIESVLAQGRDDVDVLVVDDHSTDRTADVAASYDGVTVRTNTGKGLIDVRNAALEFAEGEVIITLDADDRLVLGSLDALLAPFGNTALELVAGSAVMEDESGRKIGKVPAPPTQEHMRAKAMAFSPFSNSGSAHRNGVLQQLGGFRRGAETEGSEDFDIFSRFLETPRVCVGLSTIVCVKKVHPRSTSAKAKQAMYGRSAEIRARNRSLWMAEVGRVGTVRRLLGELERDPQQAASWRALAAALANSAMACARHGQLLAASRLVAGLTAAGPIDAVRLLNAHRLEQRVRGAIRSTQDA
jgi:glycosyltransferase involved in cell wall biosynthesis